MMRILTVGLVAVTALSCESRREGEETPSWPCSIYYQDEDGDGWGTDRTTCDWAPPEGYASRRGDCCDSDPDVHPFADFKGTPHDCPIMQWDYNCDGMVTQDFPDTGIFGGCGEFCLGEGWASSVPGCGEEGTFIACTFYSDTYPPSDDHRYPPDYNPDPLPGPPLLPCMQYENWSGSRGCR